MTQSEPPSTVHCSPESCPGARLFLIGRDSHGNWVVQDRRHTCGGLFANRRDALKFARLENGNRPEAVVMVTDVLELDMSEVANTAHQSAHQSARIPRHARRAA